MVNDSLAVGRAVGYGQLPEQDRLGLLVAVGVATER